MSIRPGLERLRVAQRLARLVVIAATALAALDAGGVDARAASVPLTVRIATASGVPSTYFRLTGAAGRTVAAGTVAITNGSAHAIAVRLDAVNGLTADTLGSSYSLYSARRVGAARWLRVGQRRLRVAPHTTRLVSVDVAVPPDASPGDMLAGVAVEAGVAPAAQSVKGLQIGETYRYVTGVEVTVPGARDPRIELTGARAGYLPGTLVFELHAVNAGNVILTGVHGRATVSGGGHTYVSQALGPGTFVTDTSIDYPLRAPRLIAKAGSTFRVQATLLYKGGIARLDTMVTFGRTAAATQRQYKSLGTPAGTQSSSSALPIVIAVILVILALAAIGVVLVRRRRVRLLDPAATSARLEGALVAAGEDSVSIITLAPPTAIGTEAVAAAIGAGLRAGDWLGTSTDGSVVAVLPGAAEDLARGMAADLRRRLGELPGGEGVAIGVATGGDGVNTEGLVSAAHGSSALV